MDQKLFDDRMGKFSKMCQGLELMPEVIFARGKAPTGRGILMLFSGPALTMESIKEIREALNVKEAQLKI